VGFRELRKAQATHPGIEPVGRAVQDVLDDGAAAGSDVAGRTSCYEFPRVGLSLAVSDEDDQPPPVHGVPVTGPDYFEELLRARAIAEGRRMSVGDHGARAGWTITGWLQRCENAITSVRPPNVATRGKRAWRRRPELEMPKPA
jgi:hypothetical protein